jgi:hypothetical protein
MVRKTGPRSRNIFSLAKKVHAKTELDPKGSTGGGARKIETGVATRHPDHDERPATLLNDNCPAAAIAA